MINLKFPLVGAMILCAVAVGCRKEELHQPFPHEETTSEENTLLSATAAVTGKRVYNVIKPGGDFWYNTKNFNQEFGVNPGDTVVLKAGTYGHIDITYIDGVTFINEGQVIVDSWNFNKGATNVKLLGNGTPGLKYGIKMNGKTNFATRWFATGELEIAYIEVDGSRMGFQIKTLPTETYPINTISLSIHDCLIQNVNQEAIYAGADELGGPFMTGKIYNVITRNSGRDGIQVRNGSFEVYDNDVSNVGMNNESGHTHGILFGGNSKNGVARNNKISNIPHGYGLFINGYGNFIVECNTISSSGSAIFTKNYEYKEDLQKVGFQNFTIRNNSLTAGNNQALESYANANGIGVTITATGNKTAGKLAVAKSITFTQSNNSSATVLTACGASTPPPTTNPTTPPPTTNPTTPPPPTTNPTTPPVTQPPANKAPVANAGADKTITLPTSSVTLAGSGSDSDGSISKYVWTKVSGPSSFRIVSPNSAQTSVTNLVAGTYSFQLKVTDNKGATHTDVVSVVVNATPVVTPPVSSKPVRIEAEKYTAMKGVQIAEGNRVGHINNGDWMEYTVNAPAAGDYNFTFRVSSPNGTRQFQVRNSSGTVLATATAPKTRWFGDYANVTVTVKLSAGSQKIRVHALSDNWDLDWLEYVKK